MTERERAIVAELVARCAHRVPVGIRDVLRPLAQKRRRRTADPRSVGGRLQRFLDRNAKPAPMLTLPEEVAIYARVRARNRGVCGTDQRHGTALAAQNETMGAARWLKAHAIEVLERHSLHGGEQSARGDPVHHVLAGSAE